MNNNTVDAIQKVWNTIRMDAAQQVADIQQSIISHFCGTDISQVDVPDVFSTVEYAGEPLRPGDIHGLVFDYKCCRKLQSLSHDAVWMFSTAILQDLPVLGGVFNELLLRADDHTTTCDSLTKWEKAVNSTVLDCGNNKHDVLDVLRICLCYAGGYGIVFAHYGRCLWRQGRAPSHLGWFKEFFELPVVVDDTCLCEWSLTYGAACIRFVRAITRSYSRLTITTRASREKRDATLRAFAERIQDTTLHNLPMYWSAVGRVCFSTWTLDWIQSGELPKGVFPHHGPGVVAESDIKPYSKGLLRASYDPSLWWVNELLLRSPMAYEQEGYLVMEMPDGAVLRTELASAVKTVPKDYRGPRVIACEPGLRQYVQEGVLAYFQKRMRRCPLSMAIDFAHPEINAQCALQGSFDRKIATLDLKDASDCVRVQHVATMLRDVPRVLKWVMALRTGRCQLPGGEVVSTTTFATMGSALTFPIESMVFATILVAGLWDRVMTETCRITPRNVRECVSRMKLHVFGDDIVIRNDLAPAAIDVLQSAGFVVNTSKCCFRSFFRESCGVDGVRGQNVVVPRPRGLPGADACTREGIIKNAQDYFRLGYWRTGVLLISIAEKTWHKVVPILPSRRDDVPGVVSDDRAYGMANALYSGVWNHNWQRTQYRSWRSALRSTSRDDGNRRYWDALAKDQDISVETIVSELPSGDRRVRLKPITFDSDRPPRRFTLEEMVRLTHLASSSVPTVRCPDYQTGIPKSDHGPGPEVHRP